MYHVNFRLSDRYISSIYEPEQLESILRLCLLKF